MIADIAQYLPAALEVQRFAKEHWRDAVEILLLSVVIYYTYLGIRGTRGARVLTGLVMLLLVTTLVIQLAGLPVIGWVVRNLSTVFMLALVIIFQPELRRLLAQLGTNRIFGANSGSRELIEEITEAVFELSSRHLGALIAIERGTEIQAQIESGVETDSLVSKELLVTVFHPKTPLHDGGLVIRNDRLAAAACIFPVTQRTDLDRNLGLRHRAALGLTEETDAVVVIVSEETGIVSIAHGGTVERDFEPGTFRNRLTQLLTEADHEKAVHSKSRSQTTLSRTGIHPVARHQEESD